MTEQEAILSVQDLLKAISAKFAHAHGFDAQELMQEVQVPALKAIRAYRKDRGTKLSTYVYHCVKNWLMAKSRSAIWRGNVRKGGEKVEDGLETLPSPGFSLGRLFTELSEEACIAVQLALAGLTQREIVKSLQQDFRLEVEVIGQIFKEVREVLNA